MGTYDPDITATDAPTVQPTKLRMRILEDGRAQYKIADECGFPASRMSEYVMGRRTPTMRHLIRLCQVLRCTPEDLRGRVGDD